MASWRVLELTDPPDQLPRLLIRPVFGRRSYTIILTDLGNVWKEELDFNGIIERATQEESPIEVTAHDTSQLSILLENIQNSLLASSNCTCHITRDSEENLIIHTALSLPEPLGSFTWRFYLTKHPINVLKDEFILPLLVNSQIQHRRIAALISTIQEKDKAITRLLDQYESSNLDLTAAFPALGGPKSMRGRHVKRDYALKHVPGLARFDETKWMESSIQFDEDDFSPTTFYEEALPQHRLKVAAQLKSEGLNETWWKDIPKTLDVRKQTTKKVKKSSKLESPPSSEDNSTEDEFEDPEAFESTQPKSSQPPPSSPSPAPKYGETDDEETTEDEDLDLDAAPKSQSQISPQKEPIRSSQRIQRSPSSSPPAETAKPVRPKGFRIGGSKSKKAVEETPEPSVAPPSDSGNSGSASGTKLGKKTFKIGGGRKVSSEARASSKVPIRNRADENDETEMPPSRSSERKVQLSVEEPARETGRAPSEQVDETAEEKAERKRLELKRKNEELAKKQAHKKKKRF